MMALNQRLFWEDKRNGCIFSPEPATVDLENGPTSEQKPPWEPTAFFKPWSPGGGVLY